MLQVTEKDENSNTPLHLATQSKRTDASPLLKYVKTHTREPIRYLTMKNIFGWTPFSGAVAIGDIEVVKQMLQGLTKEEKRSIVNQADFSNASPLHVAGKKGHVDVFNGTIGTSPVLGWIPVRRCSQPGVISLFVSPVVVLRIVCRRESL